MAFNEFQNLILRHHRFFNHLGLRHLHVFSVVFRQECNSVVAGQQYLFQPGEERTELVLGNRGLKKHLAALLYGCGLSLAV
jgi:hypothetical protein